MSKVITAIDKSKSFRVYLTVSTDVVEAARRIHITTPTATAALGRVLTGAGLMGLMMKNESDSLTVQFKGDGPAKQILATAYGNGTVKGYISNPSAYTPRKENGHLDVGGAIGVGQLTVIKDLGLKEPYVGKIALVSGEIAEDLTAYYYISEQQNTSFALGVKIAKNCSVLCAGGMVIQMLPDAEGGAVEALEKMIAEMEPLTTSIEKVILRSAVLNEDGIVEEVMNSIFKDMPEEYLPQKMNIRELRWECDCSRERMEQAVTTIGKEDLKQIIEEDKGAELVCQFCLNEYRFSKEELESIYKTI